MLPTDNPNKYEQLKAFNDRAKDSDVNAFLLKEITDSNRKQRRIEIDNAVKNYAKQLSVGAVDVEPTLNEFLDVLNKAGLEDELKEIDKEYSEYLKTK